MIVPNVLIHYGPENKCHVKVDQDSEITIGHCTISPEDWVKLKSRVDKVLDRRGLGEPKPEQIETPRGTKFILKNLVTLNKVQGGYVKPAPKWLRHWYDWVITKDKDGS